MLGMVWNANFVLEQALNPNTKDVPQELFEKCKGIVLLVMSKAGFFVSGHVGTGVMMAKKTNPTTGEAEWSPPVAIYSGGYGFGAVFGKKNDNVLIFLMDDESMKDFAARPQTRIGVTASMVLCKLGGEIGKGMDRTFEGKDTRTVRISNGAFTGITLEMGTLETSRLKQNHDFYNKNVSVSQILFDENSVEFPKDSLIPDIHKKLGKLARGETWVPGDLDRSRSGQFYQLAVQAEQEAEKEGH